MVMLVVKVVAWARGSKAAHTASHNRTNRSEPGKVFIGGPVLLRGGIVENVRLTAQAFTQWTFAEASRDRPGFGPGMISEGITCASSFPREVHAETVATTSELHAKCGN